MTSPPFVQSALLKSVKPSCMSDSSNKRPLLEVLKCEMGPLKQWVLKQISVVSIIPKFHTVLSINMMQNFMYKITKSILYIRTRDVGQRNAPAMQEALGSMPNTGEKIKIKTLYKLSSRCLYVA